MKIKFWGKHSFDNWLLTRQSKEKPTEVFPVDWFYSEATHLKSTAYERCSALNELNIHFLRFDQEFHKLRLRSNEAQEELSIEGMFPMYNQEIDFYHFLTDTVNNIRPYQHQSYAHWQGTLSERKSIFLSIQTFTLAN